MKRIIENLKEVKNIYLYLIIIILLIICITISIFYLTKESVVDSNPVLLSNEIEKEPVEEVKTIKIDIKGNVVTPGVYELSDNSRVIDAINMAGGLLENSDTTLINLSQILTDEMTIIIYSKEQIEAYKASKKEIEYVYIEVEKCPDQINDACINKAESNNKQTSKEEDKEEINPEKKEETESNTSSLVSLNKATIADLQTLSGIGESKAKAIIEYREKNGNFKSIDEIKNVSGIGDSLFEKIKDSITI